MRHGECTFDRIWCGVYGEGNRSALPVGEACVVKRSWADPLQVQQIVLVSRVRRHFHFLLFESSHCIARGGANPRLIDQSSHFEIRTDLYFSPLLATV